MHISGEDSCSYCLGNSVKDLDHSPNSQDTKQPWLESSGEEYGLMFVIVGVLP